MINLVDHFNQTIDNGDQRSPHNIHRRWPMWWLEAMNRWSVRWRFFFFFGNCLGAEGRRPWCLHGGAVCCIENFKIYSPHTCICSQTVTIRSQSGLKGGLLLAGRWGRRRKFSAVGSWNFLFAAENRSSEACSRAGFVCASALIACCASAQHACGRHFAVGEMYEVCFLFKKQNSLVLRSVDRFCALLPCSGHRTRNVPTIIDNPKSSSTTLGHGAGLRRTPIKERDCHCLPVRQWACPTYPRACVGARTHLLSHTTTQMWWGLSPSPLAWHERGVWQPSAATTLGAAMGPAFGRGPSLNRRQEAEREIT